MSKDAIYTVYIVTKTPVTKDGVSTERDVLTTYYDATWDQAHFYMKKHGAQDCSVERQSKKLGKLPRTSVLDDIQWSAAAIENTKKQAGVKKPHEPMRRAEPPKIPGVKVKIDAGYADLVNAVVGA